MSEKRVEAQHLICDRLRESAFECEYACEPEHALERHGDMLNALDLESWPPYFGRGMQSLEEMISRMKVVRSIPRDKRCQYGCCEAGCDEIDLEWLAKRLADIRKGLCLRCVREDCDEIGEVRCVHKS